MTQKTYVKSSRSGGSGGNCVEWAVQPDAVYVRDSKNPDGAELTMSHAEWSGFTTAAGANHEHPWITRSAGGATVSKDCIALTFTPAEWSAFVAAVLAGECERSVTTSR